MRKLFYILTTLLRLIGIVLYFLAAATLILGVYYQTSRVNLPAILYYVITIIMIIVIIIIQVANKNLKKTCSSYL
jgi:cytochrome c oxidase subunit IV